MTGEEQAQGDATVTPRPQPEGWGWHASTIPHCHPLTAGSICHVLSPRESGGLGHELHIQGALLSSPWFRGPIGQTPPQGHR